MLFTKKHLGLVNKYVQPEGSRCGQEIEKLFECMERNDDSSRCRAEYRDYGRCLRLTVRAGRSG